MADSFLVFAFTITYELVKYPNSATRRYTVKVKPVISIDFQFPKRTPMLQFLVTRNGDAQAVTVIINNKPVTVTAGDDKFNELIELVKNPASTEQQVEDLIFAKAKAIEAAITKDGDFRMEGGLVVYKDIVLPDSLSERLIQMAEEGFDTLPMKRFVENLAENPSNSVFRRLYSFLEVGKMAITEDGCFLTYKKITGEYKDIYTKTISNKVGEIVKVHRRMVDDDSRQTCSHGLHVCSYAYLPHFGAANYGEDVRVVVCKVNPRDVVAIPDDYNDTKMRVCEYEIISEVSDYLNEGTDILSSGSVSNGDNLTPFVIRVEVPNPAYEDGDHDEPAYVTRVHASFAKLSQAAACFEDLVENRRDEFETIELVNTVSDDVLESTDF